MKGGCNLSTATNMNHTQLNNRIEAQHKYRDEHEDEQVKTMLIMARRKLRHRHHNYHHHHHHIHHHIRRLYCRRWSARSIRLQLASWPSRYIFSATSLLAVVVMLPMLAMLLASPVAECHHVTPASKPQQQHILKTRSNLGEDEEELMIGQQFGRPESEPAADLWSVSTRSPEAHWRQASQSSSSVGGSADGPSARFTRKRENDDGVFDPFASLFDDYLREASGATRESDNGEPAAGGEQATQPAVASSRDEADNQIAGQTTRGSIELIEDDDQNIGTNNNIGSADHKPPPPSLTPLRGVGLIIDDDNSSSDTINNERQGASLPDTATDARVQHHKPIEGDNNNRVAPLESRQRQHASTNRDIDAGANNSAAQLANEIRLLFAWRSLPTNKCSKSCGRGKRVLHLSCIDSKYNVRVEDELCLRANLERPSEISDEPCNEIDCEPNWEEVAIEQCNNTDLENQSMAAISSEHHGRPSGCQSKSVFKRLECTMIDRFGETVRLNESRCNATTNNGGPSSSTNHHSQPPADDESILIDLNEQIDKERNNILSNEVMLDMESQRERHFEAPQQQIRQSSGLHSKHFRLNEPFYEPGNWSGCSGAPCGQLGRRQRQLTCHLFLSRSSRFVALPDSSCASADEPDREEPCYMDCGPAGESQEQLAPPNTVETHRSANSPSNDSGAPVVAVSKQVESALEAGIKPADLEDETIYDLEAARYVWRHGGWTKCSAKCLRGISESIVECWDKVAESSVEAKFCDSLTRPGPISKTCNEIPCPPQWHPGPFSNCSSACGSAGVRVREVLCVRRAPVVVSHEHHHHHYHRQHDHHPSSAADSLANSDVTSPSVQLQIVPEEQCIEQQQLNSSSGSTTSGAHDGQSQQQQVKPHSIEPCNRHDCQPQWQVGPWGECTAHGCGPEQRQGVRNRTVICVQEFASQFGPMNGTNVHNNGHHDTLVTAISPDLREAISLAAASWHPGKAIQVPFSECYRQFHSVPQLSEHCRQNLRPCPETEQPSAANTSDGTFIDSDPLQDFRMILTDGSLINGGHHHQLKRRTITLKVGGRAQIIEGWNVKIRCRVAKKSSYQHRHYNQPGGKQKQAVNYGLVKQPTTTPMYSGGGAVRGAQVEWRKDGVRIFALNTTVAEKQTLEETDNSIQNYGNDESSTDDKYSMMAADEPPEAHARRHQRFVQTRIGAARADKQQRSAATGAVANPRVLRVRSWSASLAPASDLGSFQFVPQKGGRFSLVKENTLRIKRLKLDDSGIYTCINGPFSESIEINVVSRRRLSSGGGDLNQNQASPNNYNQ